MQITCPPGIQLSTFLRNAGYSLPTLCGGRGNCGKCKVKVIEGELKISTMDRIQLTEDEIKQGIRLACQAMPESTIKIEIDY
ncbi:MAG: 2Fe-2S iron-sulfur cluster binding domain-containing protein [Lachnospiraceae bacterium]|nr:2Fe-2S iron-sulfur cluster binding domain-containing protein [Lachnospiraceae bacterium]